MTGPISAVALRGPLARPPLGDGPQVAPSLRGANVEAGVILRCERGSKPGVILRCERGSRPGVILRCERGSTPGVILRCDRSEPRRMTPGTSP
jgi:hypothetical protein